jgi:hypothetical protein
MGSDQPARPPTSPASREDRSETTKRALEKHKDEAEADPVRDSEDRMKQELANMEKKIDELKTLLQEK